MRSLATLLLVAAASVPAAAQSGTPVVPPSHVDSVNAQLRREPKRKTPSASHAASAVALPQLSKRPSAAASIVRDTLIDVPKIQPIPVPKKPS